MKRLLLRSREIEIDPIGRTLSRNGELTRPPRKVLDLILCLIRCREVVVTKEEIEREIWPGVRVSKASLRWLLKEVRRRLGDNGTEQRYIETTRGYGLRWIAEVLLIEADADPSDGLTSGPRAAASELAILTQGASAAEPEVDCGKLIRVAETQLLAGNFSEARDALRSAADVAERIASYEKPSIDEFCRQSPA